MDHDNGDPDRGPARRHAGGNCACNDHIHVECHQLARQCREAIQYASGVTLVNLDVLAVNPAQLTKAIHKRRSGGGVVLFPARPKQSDPPHTILLRACGEAPRTRFRASACQ